MNEEVMEEFSNLGCNDRAIVVAATHVYLELCEIKKFYQVYYIYNKFLDTIYLKGKKTKSQPFSIFIPVPSTHSLSFIKLQNFIKLKEFDEQMINITLVAPDTTCVYYQIADDLIKPNFEDDGKKIIENKREIIDANVRKYKSLIEEAALRAIPITLSTEEAKEQS